MNFDAAELLSRYLRLDTSNPPGNEHLAANFWADIFSGEDIPYRLYEPSPGRVSIRAELKGSGQGAPLILLHHTDVIAADRNEWSFDPFGGEIIDGYICGRGALDTKSLGIMQLLAFLDIRRRNLPLSRDLVFLATADEESGADNGVEYLLREHPREFDASLVLNEGSYVVEGIVPDRLLAMISPGEKGPCWMRLKRKGQPGHGSTPHGLNPLERLSEAVNRLLDQSREPRVTPIVAEYFRRMSQAWDFLMPYIEDGREETLLRIIVENDLLSVPQVNAMLRNTISLNSLHSGNKVNVIPSYAEAEIDTRLLPGQKMDEWIAFIKKQLADDEIQIEFIMKGEGNASTMDTADYVTIEAALLDHYPGAISAPYLMLGTTDSRFFREKGVISYGFCPAVIPGEHLKSIHGTDEKIGINSLLKGTDVYKDIVVRLCSDTK
ncbi:MAG: M20/M25/M40 family metallo-hydrolase [Dehalococcoidia bacterium]|nr:M20/M25/M40 family metallo-hydrolase [Dehalococcoidia bacterium]